MKKLFFFFVLILCTHLVFAQEQLINVAKQYLLAGDFEKAAATYKQLVVYNDDNPEIIDAYIQSLIGIKDFATAEKFIKGQLKRKENKSKYNFLLAKVYKEQGETKKSTKIISGIIDDLKPSQEDIKSTASLFEKAKMLDEAIKVYEKGKSLNKDNPYAFAEELAQLYDKKGDANKATTSLLDVYISNGDKSEDVKSALLRILNKPEKIDAFKLLVSKKSKENQDIIAYTDLLAWVLLQQKDYEGAFLQIKTIDNKLNEQGRRVLGFARTCLRENQYKASILAYNHVIDLGNDMPFFQTAKGEKLICLKRQLEKNPHYSAADVETVENEYELFLTNFPAFRIREQMREYADLEAKYAHNIDKAVSLLKEVTSANNAEKTFKGRCKLDMGDYELIRNEIWESTLLYSQVDKEFKQDMLGEEARFRNAKLSYYIGDFDWAQGQLDVLKASTSELIANDALNLSVLITENNPIADSNVTPLKMFARADLLAFQNKDDEAILILDSISSEYPTHVLGDNILMQKANMAYKKQDYSEAARLLQKIETEYSDDVLADDAIFNLALINENFFSNKDEAKRLYEEILTKYPGSSFVNQARKNYRRLRGDKADVE
jgi:predicted Zn-dependent protease